MNTAIIAGLLLGLGGSANAQLLHRYDFSTDASDSVGTANGTLVGTATISSGALITAGGNGTVSGIWSGTGPRVTLAPSAVAGLTNAFTIESWFSCSTGWPKYDSLYAFSDGTTANSLLGCPVMGYGPWPSGINITGGGGSANPSVLGIYLDNSSLHQTVLTYDGTNFTYYVDGVVANFSGLSSTGTDVGFNLSTLSDVGINGGSPSADPSLTGSTYDFRIYGQALTAVQVAEIHFLGSDAANSDITNALSGQIVGPASVAWNGGGSDDNWSTALNWIGGTAPATNNIDLTFAGSTRLTPNMDNNYRVNSLTFSNNASSFTLGSANASTLKFSGSGQIANNSANVQTLNLPIVNNTGGLTKSGNGMVILAGSSTLSGSVAVNVGVLGLSGSLVPNTILIGNTNVAAAIYQTGGTVTATASTGVDNLSVGNADSSYGYYAANGGTATINGIAVAGEASGNFSGNGGNGIMDINGGNVTCAGWFVVARNANAQTGVVNIYNGSLSYAGGGLVCNWGTGQTTMINVMGGSLATAANNEIGFLGGTGVVNLLGGVATVNAINGAWNGPNGQVNFNGGTLQASANSANFLAVTRATVFGRGATIDNNSWPLTIAQPLLPPTGNGVSGITSFSGGAGYIAPPIVTIAPGSGDITGNGATAIAQINPVTGTVTNIFITCPGVDYTATPTITFTGGGATTQASVTGVTLAANTCGVVTFLGGLDVITLSGASTYTGNTAISSGTLALTTGGSINNSANIVVGSGTVFDVSAISYTLPAGQGLSGSGSINGVVNAAAGSKIFGGTDGTVGSLTFNSDLVLASGAGCYLDLDTTYNGNNDLVLVNGTLTANGNSIHLKAPSTSVSLDTTADYVLITSVNPIAGSFATAPVWDVAPTNANHYSVVTSGNTVTLHYSASLAAPSLTASASITTLLRNQSTKITATVTPGSSPITSVTVDLSPLGGSTVSLARSGTSSVYTNTVVVPSAAAIGSASLTVIATDNSSLSASVAVSLTIVSSSEVWNGGGVNQNWSTNPNWSSGFAPGYAGDSLTFAGSVGLAPNMDANYSVKALTFDSAAGSFSIGTANSSTLSLAGGVTNNSPNAQTLNVPITLSAAQTFNAAAGNLTLGQGVTKGGNLVTVAGAANTAISGSVLGSGSLFKQGGGLLTISASSTWDSAQAASGGFSGPLIAQAGTLDFKNGSIQTVTGELVIGGVVANGAAGNNAKIAVDNATLNVSSWFSLGRGNGVGGVSSDLVVTNGGIITAQNFSAGYNGGSSANMPKGSIALSDTSSLTVSGGSFNVGESSGSDMTMNVNGTAAVSATAATMYVALNSGKGALNVNGGSVSVGSLHIGSGANNTSTGQGTVTVNSGTLLSEGDVLLGFAGASSEYGKMVINGGTVNFATTTKRWVIMSQWDTVNSEFDVNGGNLNVNASTDIRFATGNNTGTNTFNLNGGAVTFYSDNATTVGGSGVLDMHQGNGASVQNIFNLNGGTLSVFGILSANTAGTRTFNFNGGTLKAVTDNTSFLNLGTGSAAANVRSGGAVIDTAGFNVTIGQVLQHSAIAGDNATDGGLTKNGSGTLTLSGANTYKGNTTISAGTLELAQAVLPTNSTVSVNSGAVLELDFGTANQVGALVLNGVTQLPGVYNSSTSPAYITGSGSLIVPSPIASTPTKLTVGVSASTLLLSWPSDHLGWILQVQTNSLSEGLSTNWVDVPGSSSITSTNLSTTGAPTEFYRLRHP